MKCISICAENFPSLVNKKNRRHLDAGFFMESPGRVTWAGFLIVVHFQDSVMPAPPDSGQLSGLADFHF